MHIEKREDPNPEMGYEIRDINSKAIWKSTLWFFGFALISAVIGAVVFFTMNPGVKASAEYQIARERPELGKTVPLLQSNMEAKTDLMLMRQAEERALYGAPAQNKDGTFTIPIAAAMKMVAEGGGKQAATTQGISSTGRKINIDAKAPRAMAIGESNQTPDAVETPPSTTGGQSSQH
jgi:hypothetical protein